MRPLVVALTFASLVLPAGSAGAIPLSDIDASTTLVSLDGTVTFTNIEVLDYHSLSFELVPTTSGLAIEGTFQGGFYRAWENLLFSVSSTVSGRSAEVRVTGDPTLGTGGGAEFGASLKLLEPGARDPFYDPESEITRIFVSEHQQAATVAASTNGAVPTTFEAFMEAWAVGDMCSFCDPPISSSAEVSRVEFALVPEPGVALLLAGGWCAALLLRLWGRSQA